MRRKSTLGVCAALIALIGVTASSASTIYWTDYDAGDAGAIMQLDGVTRSNSAIIPTGVSRGYRITADQAGGMMYWTTVAGDGIYRANLDGSGMQLILSNGGPTTQGIAVDSNAGKLYYTQGGMLRRANLDGTGDELLLDAGATQLQDVQLDTAAGRLYLTEWDGTPTSLGSILSANLDGSGLSTVLADLNNGPVSIGLDTAAGDLYWVGYGIDELVGGLHRVGMDGSGATTLLADVDGESLALDLADGKIYWSTPNQSLTGGTISRANLDGSGFEDMALPAGSIPVGVAVVPEPSVLLLLTAGTIVVLRRR